MVCPTLRRVCPVDGYCALARLVQACFQPQSAPGPRFQCHPRPAQAAALHQTVPPFRPRAQGPRRRSPLPSAPVVPARSGSGNIPSAVDPDSFGGAPANDGQKFADQDDDDVQQPFVALFATQANTEWVTEHNAVIAHRILLGNVAPMPCPPSKAAVRQCDRYDAPERRGRVSRQWQSGRNS